MASVDPLKGTSVVPKESVCAPAHLQVHRGGAAVPEHGRESQDRQWLLGIAAGDAAAFEALFRTYHEPLCRYAARQVACPETASDLVQNVFERLWRKRTRLHVQTTVRAYLYGAIRHEAVDFRRRTRVRDRFRQMVGWSQTHHEDELLHRAELRAHLREAIAALPDRCRAVMTLRWEDGLSHAEIAEALSISRKTVENQITIAFRSLRPALAVFRD